MSKQLDMTPQPDLSQKTGTGPVRTRLPVWRPALPPCNHACPAGENIQAWLALAEAGRFEAAWQTLIEENPLPAVHGRVCYHPCETACNRAQVDDAVSIHAIERFLGDEALARGWQPAPPAPASGKKVLVIGAGPSGLSCAWHLNRLGHQVEIREAGPLAGGMLRFGIPAYRLPRHVLDREVARIVAAGVTLSQLATAVGHDRKIIRAMPNTPALIQAGMSGVYATPEVTAADRALTERILSAIGQFVWVDEETDMDGITAISGSGPAYVFYFIESMMAAAERMGLSAEQGGLPAPFFR